MVTLWIRHKIIRHIKIYTGLLQDQVYKERDIYIVNNTVFFVWRVEFGVFWAFLGHLVAVFMAVLPTSPRYDIQVPYGALLFMYWINWSLPSAVISVIMQKLSLSEYGYFHVCVFPHTLKTRLKTRFYTGQTPYNARIRSKEGFS